MALRVLSGIIFIPNGGSRRGNVEISFNPFALANASNAGFEFEKEKGGWSERALHSKSRFHRRRTAVRHRPHRS